MFGKKSKEHWQEGVYLTSVQSEMEADIIESKLKSENIPSIRKFQGAGGIAGIIMGPNLSLASSIDIYVLEETLEAAKEIIVPIPILDDEEYEFIPCEDEMEEE